MSDFDTQTLEHLKQLCRIDCSPEEEKDILSSLQKILGYVEQLQEVDTTGVAPCSYVLQSMMTPILREDEAIESFPREQFIHSAPDQIGGMIRTPPVLKSL